MRSFHNEHINNVIITKFNRLMHLLNSNAEFFFSPDARFILRFLRFKKFSVEQTKEALERYVLLRQTFGVAFNCLDITIPMMEELTNLGYMFACPKRDSKGRRVIVARPGKYIHYIK